MMTIKEYTDKLDRLTNLMRLREKHGFDYDDLYDEYVELQFSYMEEVLKEYKKTIGDSPAKQICYELLDYAIHWSQSGNAIVYEEDEDLANKVDDIIYDELGDYLLDVETYYDRYEKAWAIDCMFGGYFVPDWDGITEYLWED